MCLHSRGIPPGEVEKVYPQRAIDVSLSRNPGGVVSAPPLHAVGDAEDCACCWNGLTNVTGRTMNQQSPGSVRDLAQLLLAFEAADLNSVEHHTPALFRVSEKLRSSLTRLAGAAGFSTLLARALTLARNHTPGTPALHALRVSPDGTLETPGELQDDIAEAGVLLIAELLGLLVLFIGESLVLRLLLDIWPNLSVSEEPKQESKT